ncbi:ABC transporter permease [Rhodococcus tibetensis]|uniref:ABC transporter permease n=1 Tax=Rhodococcus tibetensis TaxID=2965064 RepID=A0ABT1QM45_9NOCA|nr:ABC transporter permease [Rhodococcus sp. FXJ9.536]MCQ4122728.1 ABC transporter permease [Rhodococcus sp. FXJ9.536]
MATPPQDHRGRTRLDPGSALAAVVAGRIVRGNPGARAFGTFFGCFGSTPDVCRAESVLTATTVIAVAVPVLLGLLVGVTVFSRDIEQGTHVLGLSQSVSRARWFWMRILVVFVPISVAMAVLGFILEWSRSYGGGKSVAFISGFGIGVARLTFPLFQSSGLVLGTYTFLALIIGSAAALIVRNTLGAMVITLVATASIMVGLQLGARPHYAPTSIEARPLSGAAAYASSGNIGFWFDSWTVGSDYVNADGSIVDIDREQCDRAFYSDDFGQHPDETYADYNARTEILYQQQQRDYEGCLRAQGADHFEVRYHADNRFRQFQLTEAALALLIAAAFLVPARWGLRRLRP